MFRESPRARSQDPNRAVSRHHPTHDQARPRRPPSHVSHTVHRAPTTGSDEPHPLPQPGLLGRTDPSNGQLNEPQSSGVFPSPLGSLPRPRYVTAPRHRGVALPIHGVLLLSDVHRFASFLSRTRPMHVLGAQPWAPPIRAQHVAGCSRRQSSRRVALLSRRGSLAKRP